MPLAENSHDRAYILSRSSMTHEEEALHAMVCHVKDATERAFKEFPLDDDLSAKLRLERILGAINKAGRTLSRIVNVPRRYDERMADDLERVADFNSDCDKQAVLQSAGSYLYVYETIIGSRS